MRSMDCPWGETAQRLRAGLRVPCTPAQCSLRHYSRLAAGTSSHPLQPTSPSDQCSQRPPAATCLLPRHRRHRRVPRTFQPRLHARSIPSQAFPDTFPATLPRQNFHGAKQRDRQAEPQPETASQRVQAQRSRPERDRTAPTIGPPPNRQRATMMILRLFELYDSDVFIWCIRLSIRIQY